MTYTMYRGQSPVPPATAPGRAYVQNCPDCAGAGCRYCDQSGKVLLRACPRCGDPAWDLVSRPREPEAMACRLGCGYQWDATDPGWLLQRLPTV